jgi:arylsulfatase A-like enzyme
MLRVSRRAETVQGLALLTLLSLFLGAGCDSRAAQPTAAALERVAFADAETLAALDGWDRRPERIVLIVADTLRRDVLSAYGGTAKTPHLDALAGRSQVFQNAYGSYYQTSMSMGSLFTGRTPSIESGDPANPLAFGGSTWCGMARFSTDRKKQKTCVPEQLPTLGQAVRRSGYWTIGVASNGFLFEPFGVSKGFDDWSEVGERMLPMGIDAPSVRERIVASRSARAVNRAVWNALLRRKSNDFFLYVHYMDVHDYYGIGKMLDLDEYEAANPDQAEIERRYMRSIEGLDEAVGTVLSWLETAGLMEGTAIVFTADHGERLSDEHFTRGRPWHAGNPAFEELIGVPLFVTPRGSDHDSQLMRSEDIFRLISDLAGADLGGQEGLARDELFVSEPEYQTYRRGRWKSYLQRADGAHFLIDLEADPGEVSDVAASHPEIVASHAERIEELSQELAAEQTAPTELSEEELQRLRALGYVE